MTNEMKNPAELVVVNPEIKRAQVDFIQDRVGTYRAIVKVKAGFMVTVDDLGLQANWGKKQWNSARDVFRGFKRGALQSIQFQPEGTNSWLTVFAKVGTKIKLIDNALLASLEVGDINQDWSNSNLYSQTQYQAVGSKTWACKAYVKNI
jgi:putative heme degradation protein